MNKIYTIENIDCANCAAKIEGLINKLPEVETASITFATKQLRVTAENPDSLIKKIEELANTIENGVFITERKRLSAKKKTQSTNIERSEEPAQGCCDCHEHGHEHEESHNHEHGDKHKHDHKQSSDYKVYVDKTSEKKPSMFSRITDLHIIVLGTAMFIIGILAEQLGLASIVQIGLLAVAYLILGGEILLTALRNIGKGQIFDENFLMSIATIGAFVIQEYPEAVGVMLFFRIGEYFEEKAVERSRNQIMETVDLRPEVVYLVSGEGVREIPAEQAEVGDILMVRPGDRIPLDGTVVEGESRIDTAPITGEPVPRKVEQNSSVVSGCINTSGALKIRVEKTLENSMVTRILDSVENAAASKPKIDKFITKFARIYTPFVVFFAVATAIIPSLITGDWEHWVYTALTFLVISCPCALVLSVPLAFFSGIGAGSRKGILFKGGVALEALKSIKAVVMDKTGTITKGEFNVQKIICSGNLIAYMTSGMTSAEGVLKGLEERPVGISKQDVEKYLLYLAANCEMKSNHPIGSSILRAAEKVGIKLKEPQNVTEIAGMGIRAKMTEGIVLCGNRKLMDKCGVDMSGYSIATISSEVLIALNGDFVGALLISDSIKEESKAAIEKLKDRNITTVMLTGDGQESAEAVAASTGIERVFAKLLPEDKLRILQELRGETGSVMFVGDGINDAPVLAGADVGAAMGSGADAAIEAADVVFMTSSLEAVPQAIEIAKTTSRIAIQNVVFALAIKGIVMVLGLAGIASMWMAVFADSGVAMLCVLNSIRVLYRKQN